MEKIKVNKVDVIRHSLSHVLAMAVIDMFPEAKLGIGPATEDGFYYDFDLPRTLIPEDLPILEAKMREIIKSGVGFKKYEEDAKKAYKKEEKRGANYKTELIGDLIKEGTKKVTYYQSGDFLDLCAGPHVKNTKELSGVGFKLSKIAGAYWRGSEKNKMLQRIYGIAFLTPKELRGYEKMLEEAEKRDHRKIGQELDLFTFSDLVGPGLPLFTPRGTILIDELQKKIEGICKKYGYEKVITPHIAKEILFEKSGHKQKFGKELFRVISETKEDYALKPVQCPHQTQIYASRVRSYRDLPIRYMESNKQYRNEQSGEISGLSRVIAITVEDGHVFCRMEQVKKEVKMLVKIVKDFYKSLGLWDDFWISLSTHDPEQFENYIGTKEDWKKAETILKEVSNEMNLGAKVCKGEAALYGPKLDFMFKDAMGREIQIPTIQLDFATPQRFELTYINEKGEKENPVMVHRAILGSYERFLVMLIEHYAGEFPVWLAPVQASVITVGASAKKFAKEVYNTLKENNIRAELRDENETVGKKIREAELGKVPYMLVVGDKEVKAKAVAVRKLHDKKIETVKINKFVDLITKEVSNEN
ncbi:MAG: threonine--tRNA ligase [Patescibacteria group bacterium]|nr:threonine--tRNA ligase [Patescibacteria group bacterium]